MKLIDFRKNLIFQSWASKGNPKLRITIKTIYHSNETFYALYARLWYFVRNYVAGDMDVMVNGSSTHHDPLIYDKSAFFKEILDNFDALIEGEIFDYSPQEAKQISEAIKNPEVKEKLLSKLDAEFSDKDIVKYFDTKYFVNIMSMQLQELTPFFTSVPDLIKEYAEKFENPVLHTVILFGILDYYQKGGTNDNLSKDEIIRLLANHISAIDVEMLHSKATPDTWVRLLQRIKGFLKVEGIEDIYSIL